MKRKILVFVTVAVILVVSIVVSAILIKTKPVPPSNIPAPSEIKVKAFRVENKTYDVEILYPARVLAQEIVKLGVQVSGKIETGGVPLKVGQHFKKGDLLVNIYDEDVVANIKSQKSAYLNTIAKSLPDIKIDFPAEFDKWSGFFEKIELDKPLPPLPKINSTKEKVYLSAKGILSSYYTLQQQEIILDRYKIYAPFNGVFKEVTKEVGAIATANGEVGTIISTDNLELAVGVSPAEAKMLSIGESVIVKSLSAKTYTGRIVRISPSIDQKTQRVMLYISLKEPSFDIIEGQMIDAVVTIKNLQNVVRVPREIISKKGQVYEIIDNHIRPIDVQVVLNSELYSYISGLKDNTVIVYESLLDPKESTLVKITETVENK